MNFRNIFGMAYAGICFYNKEFPDFEVGKILRKLLYLKPFQDGFNNKENVFVVFHGWLIVGIEGGITKFLLFHGCKNDQKAFGQHVVIVLNNFMIVVCGYEK